MYVLCVLAKDSRPLFPPVENLGYSFPRTTNCQPSR